MNEHPYDSLTPDWSSTLSSPPATCSDARLLALNSYENRVYQVGIEDADPLIAKFYRPQRWSEAQIWRSTASAWICRRPTSRWWHPGGRPGTSLHRFHDFQFALFPRRGGYPPELDNLDNLLVLGRTLGRIHALGRAKASETPPAISVARMLAAAESFYWRNFIPRDLMPAYESSHRRPADHGRATFTATVPRRPDPGSR